MTAGDGPAAMVLDLAVEPATNLSAVRGHIATALHDLGEDHRYDVALVVTELVSNVLDLCVPRNTSVQVGRHRRVSDHHPA